MCNSSFSTTHLPSHPSNPMIVRFVTVLCKYFPWESEKMIVKFHKNCEKTGKILKISCVRCHFLKLDIYFLGLP